MKLGAFALTLLSDSLCVFPFTKGNVLQTLRQESRFLLSAPNRFLSSQTHICCLKRVSYLISYLPDGLALLSPSHSG